MVPASTMKKVLHLLNDGNVNVTVTIPDVERLIIKREKKNGISELQQRYRDDSGSITGRSTTEFNKYDFYSYGSYKEMMKWLRSLARKYPEFVRNISIGKSHEKRSIDGLEVCDK
ncbi:Zinc carboxypeptidase family protein [Brugia pahangi]